MRCVFCSHYEFGNTNQSQELHIQAEMQLSFGSTTLRSQQSAAYSIIWLLTVLIHDSLHIRTTIIDGDLLYMIVKHITMNRRNQHQVPACCIQGPCQHSVNSCFPSEHSKSYSSTSVEQFTTILNSYSCTHWKWRIIRQ